MHTYIQTHRLHGGKNIAHPSAVPTAVTPPWSALPAAHHVESVLCNNPSGLPPQHLNLPPRSRIQRPYSTLCHPNPQTQIIPSHLSHGQILWASSNKTSFASTFLMAAGVATLARQPAMALDRTTYALLLTDALRKAASVCNKCT